VITGRARKPTEAVGKCAGAVITARGCAGVPDDRLSEPSSAGIVTTSDYSAAPSVRLAHLVCGRGSGCVRAAVSVQLGSR
jgi:hypothetical protein